MKAIIDPVSLTRELVRCASVTPDDAGTLDIITEHLASLGFACQQLVFSDAGTADVANLFARYGEGSPHFAFAGHVDVVPPGPREAWSVDAFSGDIIDGTLFGRGSVDMKSGVAAAIAGVSAYLAHHDCPGSISFLLTADEEGPAKNGTKKLMEWTKEQGIEFDGCIVGEPTSRAQVGDLIKIGRRGSLNARLIARGSQGHVAYPARADNAAHRLIKMLQLLVEGTIDRGSEWFDPTSLQVTSIDIGNSATNVIPGEARASFNIRFSDLQTCESLETWLRSRLAAAGGEYTLDLEASGDVFRTEPGLLIDQVSQAVEAVIGQRPELSTSGGTSDARFIQAYAPVVELGLVGQHMHQVDERVSTADIEQLTTIYTKFLKGFFQSQ